MQLMKASTSAAVRATGVRAQRTARPAVLRVRAEAENKTPAEGNVMYGGRTYTEAEFAAAKANGTLPQQPAIPGVATGSFPSFTEVMGFSGAPEIINGRLAMLGFVAALGAELASGESVLKQVSDEPTLITLTFILFIAASLVPAFLRKKGETVGPFTPAAELLNGRAAMIGFAAMLALEVSRNAALF